MDLLPAAGRAGTALSAAAAEDARHALAPNTVRAYRGAYARLMRWLAGSPLDDASLASFVRELASAGRAPATATFALNDAE